MRTLHICLIERTPEEFGWVLVSLSDAPPVPLPFTDDGFADLVLDAQRRGQIADFTSMQWIARLQDLVAMRDERRRAVTPISNTPRAAGSRVALRAETPHV